MELVVIKNSAKPDNKLFWSCLILLDFFTLFQIICPALQSNELNVLRVSKMTLQRDGHSYTPWKSQINFCFSDVFRRYRNGNAVPVSLLFAIQPAYKPGKSLVDFKQYMPAGLPFSPAELCKTLKVIFFDLLLSVLMKYFSSTFARVSCSRAKLLFSLSLSKYMM